MKLKTTKLLGQEGLSISIHMPTMFLLVRQDKLQIEILGRVSPLLGPPTFLCVCVSTKPVRDPLSR